MRPNYYISSLAYDVLEEEASLVVLIPSNKILVLPAVQLHYLFSCCQALTCYYDKRSYTRFHYFTFSTRTALMGVWLAPPCAARSR
jgi:hypothetical protein